MWTSNIAVSITALCYGFTAAAWPDTPFTTNGRNIVSSSGAPVVYAGANWPGAADTMLPEGLQYSSIANIVSQFKSLGMNVVRLTYAIEMIDDYFSDSPNQSLANTLTNALGEANGQTVLNQILQNNPQFSADTTRLEIFDAVAAECANQELWIHLDNHVSKAEWCCSETDGNAWFGDTYFDVLNWQRGLGFMANRAKSWTALASMSLRNELREPDDNPNPSAQDYDWQTWYANMIPAADAIYGNNSLPLIFFSGLNYDTDDTALVNKQDLGGGTYFNPSSFSFANKLVIELHDYQSGTIDCAGEYNNIYTNAYGAMNESDPAFYHVPIVMTEFGFSMEDGSYNTPYAQCLKQALPTLPGGAGGWMQWVMAGSYYIRQGSQDTDESYGILNHNWNGFRNETVVDEYIKPFVQATLS